MKLRFNLMIFVMILALLTQMNSCRDPEPVKGCTNPNALNYNPDAEESDGSCIVSGCTDQESTNFNPEATQDDGSCTYRKDLFIGTYVGTTECDNPIINMGIGGQEVTFTIAEIPGENNKVTVEVGFSIDLLTQTPEAEIDENNVLKFDQEQKGVEVDITMDGVNEVLDIRTTGELTLDEATMDILSGDIVIQIKDSATGVLFIMSTCEAEAERQ